ncbi:MAG: hypothetical protein ACTSP4_07055, partial [Candidatus Hodarchaeales archaeon]
MMIRISDRLQKVEKITPLLKRSKIFQIFTISLLVISFFHTFIPLFNQEEIIIEDTEIIPSFPEKLSNDFTRINPSRKLPQDNMFFIYKNKDTVFNTTVNNTDASSSWILFINNTRQNNANCDIFVDGTWLMHREIMNSSSVTVRITISAGNHSLQLNTWTDQIKQYVREYFYHEFADGEEYEEQITIETVDEFIGEKTVDYLFVEPNNVSWRALEERKQYVEDIIGDFSNVRQTYLEMS